MPVRPSPREGNRMMAARGVNNVVIEFAEGNAVKVFGNGMVDVNDFPSTSAAQPQRIWASRRRFASPSSRRSSTRRTGRGAQEGVERHYDLIPKTIIVDDMLASICYLLNLGHGIGTVDDIDHPGANRRLRCVGELPRTSSASASPAWSASSVSA